MHTQPRLLTVIIAQEDLAKTYTTIHSIQNSRYRNHEIVCVIPFRMTTLRKAIARDFKWLPVLTSPYASVSTLLNEAIERARISYCDVLCFIQAGTNFERNDLHILADQINTHSEHQIIIPAVMRADGSGAVYGATNDTPWPHLLRAVVEVPQGKVLINSRFMGGVCAIRLKTAIKYAPKQSADELALLYWTEYMLHRGVSSIAVTEVTVLYDNPLFCDFSDMMLVPESWYRDALRYVRTYGTWYNKIAFLIRYRWRLQSSPIARLLQLGSSERTVEHTHWWQ